ncbi:MAG: T9SS type A sorting domain-containing protein [Psychroserpens sp.]|uniref:T9SS type A sorting domain-containing protein n=1 Tax=Psychroserpens sp. TaxID=2020870 RepID=UPI003002D23B
MGKQFLFGIMAFCFFAGHSQNSSIESETATSNAIIRSNLGSSGGSTTMSTSNGIYVISQSIGQSSIIGTESNSGFTLRQGYQQPSLLIEVSSNTNSNILLAKIYPNPFSHYLFITFSENITNEVKILLFDIKGSLIYSQKFAPSQTLKLNLGDYANGNYILNIESNNKSFSTKLIKR